MPSINLTIRSYGQEKTIIVDSDLTLSDYEQELYILISEMSKKSEFELEEHQFLADGNIIELDTRICDLESLGYTTIEAKPTLIDAKHTFKNFELGLQFLSAMPEKYQRNLVVSVTNDEDLQTTIQNRVKALCLAFECGERKIDTEYLKLIHKTCKGDFYPHIKGGEFYNTKRAGAPFGFQFLSLSLKALEDAILFAKKYSSFGIEAKIGSDIILSKKPGDDLLSNIKDFKSFQTKLITAYSLACVQYPQIYKGKAPLFFYSIDHSEKECEAVLERIFENYHLKIEKAKSLNDDNLILQVIIECQYDILMLQGFEDLNTRTSIVLFNILLMQNNFPPTSLFQAGISQQEFFSVVKNGMLKTLKSIEETLISESTSQILFDAKARITKLKDFPQPNWIIHHDMVTNTIKVGKGLTRFPLDPRFFSREEQLRYCSSFSQPDKKSERSKSHMQLPKASDSLRSTKSSPGSSITPEIKSFSGSFGFSSTTTSPSSRLTPDISRSFGSGFSSSSTTSSSDSPLTLDVTRSFGSGFSSSSTTSSSDSPLTLDVTRSFGSGFSISTTSVSPKSFGNSFGSPLTPVSPRSFGDSFDSPITSVSPRSFGGSFGTSNTPESSGKSFAPDVSQPFSMRDGAITTPQDLTPKTNTDESHHFSRSHSEETISSTKKPNRFRKFTSSSKNHSVTANLSADKNCKLM